MPTRILLVDDHELFREAMAALFAKQADIELVAEARGADDAYSLIGAAQFDMILIDLALPGVDGVAAIRELRRRGARQPILVLTMHTEIDFVVEALAAGASGFALKRQPSGEILEAVRRVAAGTRYLAPQINPDSVQAALADRVGRKGDGPLAVLSPREREVFGLLVAGRANQAIADELSITVKTVETHRTRVLRKLRVHSIVELVRLAARHHLVPETPAVVAASNGNIGNNTTTL
jgi:DNA-binding NarL/FixJ family response regulator